MFDDLGLDRWKLDQLPRRSGSPTASSPAKWWPQWAQVLGRCGNTWAARSTGRRGHSCDLWPACAPVFLPLGSLFLMGRRVPGGFAREDATSSSSSCPDGLPTPGYEHWPRSGVLPAWRSPPVPQARGPRAPAQARPPCPWGARSRKSGPLSSGGKSALAPRANVGFTWTNGCSPSPRSPKNRNAASSTTSPRSSQPTGPLTPRHPSYPGREQLLGQQEHGWGAVPRQKRRRHRRLSYAVHGRLPLDGLFDPPTDRHAPQISRLRSSNPASTSSTAPYPTT